MKSAKPEIEAEIDITPWAKHPNSGIGRTAIRTFEALKQSCHNDYSLRSVSRIGQFQRPRRFNFKGVSLYHGFEHRLPLTLGIIRILTVHDLWTLEPNLFQSRLYQRRQSRRLNSAIASATAIITPTEVVKSQLLERFPFLKDRVFAIHHGWQLDIMGPTSPVSPKIDAFLSAKSPYILTVACIEYRKNISILIDSLKNLEIRIVLVGAPGFGNEGILQQIVNHPRRDQILYLPEASEIELRTLMKCAAAYVQPSWDEGFGMPVIDAIHFGKRVLLSQIPTFKEIAGNMAIYFDPQSPGSLAKCIIHALPNPNPTPLRVSEHMKEYTWENAARKLLNVYEFAIHNWRTHKVERRFFPGFAKNLVQKRGSS